MDFVKSDMEIEMSALSAWRVEHPTPVKVITLLWPLPYGYTGQKIQIAESLGDRRTIGERRDIK